jgi:hypothetical protein
MLLHGGFTRINDARFRPIRSVRKRLPFGIASNVNRANQTLPFPAGLNDSCSISCEPLRNEFFGSHAKTLSVSLVHSAGDFNKPDNECDEKLKIRWAALKWKSEKRT